MNTTTSSYSNDTHAQTGLISLTHKIIGLLKYIPYSLIALLARFSIAAVFWKSAQTKVQDFSIDFISGDFHLGIPRLSDSAVDLFRDEYRLPFFPPEIAAPLAAFSEHFFQFCYYWALQHDSQRVDY